MADEEYKIIIKAIDDASRTLNDISKNVDSLSKTSEKTNKSVQSSFKSIQGAMLNLGQVAQGVHNIFETYQNRMRSVENAQDRVENSTLRLKQAQQDLQDVTRSFARDELNLEKAQLNDARAKEELLKYTKRLELGITFTGDTLRDYEDAQINAKEAALELAEAQQKVSDQSRILSDKQDAVTIANNGLERSQRSLNKALGDAKWAYVDMGMQALSVTGNLSVLANSFGLLSGGVTSTTTAMGGLSTAVAGGGLLTGLSSIAGILGVGAVGAGLIWALYEFASAQAEAAKAYDEFTTKFIMPGLDVESDGTITKAIDISNFDPTKNLGTSYGETTGSLPYQQKGTRTFGSVNIMPKSTKGGLIGALETANMQTEYLATQNLPNLKNSADVNFTQMSTKSVEQINQITVALENIPTDVYTYHHIVTVYD